MEIGAFGRGICKWVGGSGEVLVCCDGVFWDIGDVGEGVSGDSDQWAVF